AQNKFFPYHWLPLCAPAAILLADALGAVLARIKEEWAIHPLPIAAPLLCGVVAVMAFRQAPSYRSLARIALDGESLTASYRRIPENQNQFVRGLLDAVKYVDEHSNPDESIFVWGFEPGIYFLTGRPCPSRFIYNFPLYGACGWPRLQQEFLG